MNESLLQLSVLSQATYIVYAVYIACLFILGIPVYLLSFRFLIKHLLHRHKVRELSPHLLNICSAYFMSLVVQFPIVFTASINKGWSGLGHAPCYIAGIVNGTCSTVVALTFTLMAVKLFRMVENDLSNQDIIPISHRPSCLIGVTWLVSIALFVPTTIGWNSVVADGPHCSPNWFVDNIPDVCYLVVLVIASFVVPLTVCIMYFIKTSRYLMRHNYESCTTHQMRLRLLHIDARNLVGVLTIVYIVLRLPYWICGFFTLFAKEKFKKGDLAIIPWLCTSLSVVYFPFMYVAMNKRFRKTLLSMLGLKKTRKISPVVTVEQTETFEVLSTKSGINQLLVRTPSILIPRSPLVNNNQLRLSVFENVQEEIITQHNGTSNTTVTRLIRCSLHATQPEDVEGGSSYKTNLPNQSFLS